jgi:hypothetical protein
MEVVVRQNEQELERLEGVIQKNIGAFYEVGRALMEIRDKGLYKDVLGFETFEAYCKDRWDFTKSYANYLVSATTVIENLSEMTTIVVKPSTESQTRPLAKLEPEQQRAAWKQAVETAPEGMVTAAHVYKIVKGMENQGKGPESTPQVEESDALFQLKRWWKKATKKDKKIFLDWTKGVMNNE